VAAGTLVPIGALKFAHPRRLAPVVIHRARRVDYGPRWPAGLITREPPAIGPPFPALVSQVDAAGNEVAGVRGVELLAPLATYAPWQLRGGRGTDAAELADFLGTYVPFPRTESERQRGRQPARIDRRYPDKRLPPDGGARCGITRAGGPFTRTCPGSSAAEQRWDWVMSR
jgi:hypothetical protein